MTNEELQAYALKGMKADIIERAASVRSGMESMKTALDSTVAGTATRARFTAPIDNLMSALVAFSEAMDRTEAFSHEK